MELGAVRAKEAEREAEVVPATEVAAVRVRALVPAMDKAVEMAPVPAAAKATEMVRGAGRATVLAMATETVLAVEMEEEAAEMVAAAAEMVAVEARLDSVVAARAKGHAASFMCSIFR
jgi:hypothetical protein